MDGHRGGRQQVKLTYQSTISRSTSSTSDLDVMERTDIKNIEENKTFSILVINPGSTSTKIAVYENEKAILLRNIKHPIEELAKFEHAIDQREFRRDLVVHELESMGIPMKFDAIIGRGGLSRPVKGGVYEVNEKMCKDTYHAIRRHACNLGCIIAYELAARIPDCKAYIADPGMVDELDDMARITGSPLMPRIAIWHALNQRAVARRHAKAMGCTYKDLNLIICHLGGGISIAAHKKGYAVDANNALDGEGPLSPERAGTLPAADLIHLCYSGRYTEDELLKKIAGKAGLVAHLGTNDVKEILKRIENGDKKAELLVNAMIYQTAKAIAGLGAVFCGKVDAILLTGGMAYSEYITSRLRQRLEFLAPIYIYPGEDEMSALALNALDILRGERHAKQYE